MDEIQELKSQAYDLIVALEVGRSRLQEIQNKLAKLSSEVPKPENS